MVVVGPSSPGRGAEPLRCKRATASHRYARKAQLAKRPSFWDMAHPTGFEPVASAFGGQRSIQLSYGCLRLHLEAGGRARKSKPVGKLDRLERAEPAAWADAAPAGPAHCDDVDRAEPVQ